MNNDEQTHDVSAQKLAQWLQELLINDATSTEVRTSFSTTTPLSVSGTSSATKATLSNEHEIPLELLWQDGTYHKSFYQQLPDFVEALLNNDPQAPLRYAALIYHLAGCDICHQSYLEIYDAMQHALFPQGARPTLGQSTRTTPERMLVQLCQAWITQAEAVLRDAREQGTNEDTAVRTLLQSAIQMSAGIRQESMRQQARQGLVQVATLFDEPNTPQTSAPDYSFIPVLTGARGVRRRGNEKQPQTEFAGKDDADQFVIDLHAQGLEGSVIQRGKTLELRLHDLEAPLRGQHVVASIALGSLIEPIRWSGGNPRAIYSPTSVDMTGTLVMPLGQTELQVDVPEERNLLETTFMLIEIRKLP